ncbi:LuxR C-terminal-related transcriptional regulator [Paraburkholderia kururiensis]|uniref:LuxR C-terminal-related transcriptional regulator n=1 Tax=Paraburkholderia kururiensis TaxID=984307 RepID=UPI0005AA9D4E|nr:response regulator transcription factor [Paraburkholderia kururiensis]
MIHILIAGTQAMIRGALTQVISAQRDMVVTAEFLLERGVSLDATKYSPADLLLFDATTPATESVGMIDWVSAERPALPLLILTGLGEASVVPYMLRMGARGCVARESATTVLIDAIREISAGRRFVDPAIVNTLLFGDAISEELPEGLLSRREYQVLKLIAAGRTISDIARAFSLSVKTVSTHKTRLMRKLNVDNNAELMRYALSHGFSLQ